MISKRTRKYLEIALADKQSALEIAIALQSSGGGNVTAEIEQLKLDVEILQFDLLNLQSNVQALNVNVQAASSSVANKQTIHQEILTIFQITQTPALSIQSAAGTGAYAAFIGPATNNAGTIVLSTGSAALSPGAQFQFEADIAPGNDRAIVCLTPGNADTAAVMSQVYVVPSVQGKWQLLVATALDPNKTYYWYYLTICVK